MAPNPEGEAAAGDGNVMLASLFLIASKRVVLKTGDVTVGKKADASLNAGKKIGKNEDKCQICRNIKEDK